MPSLFSLLIPTHNIISFLKILFRYAHEKEVNRRMEEVCRENQIAFHRMMEEAESTAQVLEPLFIVFTVDCVYLLLVW